MTQHDVAEPSENLTVAARVPLAERPLIADDENTVITSPEQPRVEVRSELTPEGNAYTQRLFPAGGKSTGDEAGIRLAHFEIESRLGSGGMGAVFRARDLELSRDVALKILHPSSSQDSSLIARFRNEARACAQLSHDNIARVFYAGSQDGLYFIAYEYASGQTIRDLIQKRGRISVEDTVNYAIQVTLALNHIAAAGIVHRDIKPSNIMLTPSGRVKVVDLGLARRDISDSIGDITVAGTTLGTFDYISPEQARDPRNADVRSDIYSLGCTMYHMLTGQPPYPEGTALQKLLDHQGKSPPDPSVLNPKIPPELVAIMRRMMANSPSHRYAEPGLLLNELIQLASLLGLRSVPAEGIVWRRMKAESDFQPMGAVWVFLSVLLICLTAVFLHHSSSVLGPGTETVNEIDQPGTEVDPAHYAASSVNSLIKSGTDSSLPGSVDATGATSNGVTPRGSAVGAGAASALPSGSASVSGSRRPSPVLPTVGPVNPAMIDILMSQQETAGRPAAPVTTSSDPFLLQSSDGTTRSFRTLKAAVADARSGDVVLLRYNGFPDDLPAQPPVRIVGMNLIIRAAEGFRPTLEFDGMTEGTVTPGRMFSLRSRGSLTIRDLDLRLVVRDSPTADRWTMFSCEGANRVSLENVSVECVNPDFQPAAIFDLTDEPASPSESGGRNESEYSLNRVICRANADIFRVACQPRGRVILKNCGFAVNGRLLQMRGDSSMQPVRGALSVFMEHVTCIHTDPMINMNDGDDRLTGTQRTLPTVSVRSEAGVFTGVGTDPRLIVSEGSSYAEEMESLLSWTGYSNVYDGHGSMWEVKTSALDFSTRRLDFSQWLQLWQSRADCEDTNSFSLPLVWYSPGWQTGAAHLNLAGVTPASFELDPTLFGVGPGGLPRARDGLVPGVNAQELPPFPRSANASKN